MTTTDLRLPAQQLQNRVSRLGEKNALKIAVDVLNAGNDVQSGRYLLVEFVGVLDDVIDDATL